MRLRGLLTHRLWFDRSNSLFTACTLATVAVASSAYEAAVAGLEAGEIPLPMKPVAGEGGKAGSKNDNLVVDSPAPANDAFLHASSAMLPAHGGERVPRPGAEESEAGGTVVRALI